MAANNTATTMICLACFFNRRNTFLSRNTEGAIQRMLRNQVGPARCPSGADSPPPTGRRRAWASLAFYHAAGGCATARRVNVAPDLQGLGLRAAPTNRKDAYACLERSRRNKGSSYEEPCDGKLSRTVRERRWGPRGPRRPQLA